MAKRKLPYVHTRRRRDGTLAFRGYANDADGRRIFSATYDTEVDAYEAALRMRGEVSNLTSAESLDDACEFLLDELRTKRTRGTVRWYSDHLRAVRRLLPGDMGLCSIAAEAVEQYIRDRLASTTRRCTAATVNADLRALHRVFAVAIRRGVVQDNPVRRVDRPRADAPAMDWFTRDELQAVLERVPTDLTRDVLLLFALTGVRRSEAARLEPDHVRMQALQLIVPGKNATRVVPLAPEAIAPLRRLLARATDVLLPGGVHAIDDLFKAARNVVADRRLHPHALRHTFGTALIRSGVRPDVVMRLMGHRVLATTMRYVHKVGEDGVRAVRLLRFLPGESSPAAQE